MCHAAVREQARPSSSPPTATRRRSRWCAPAPSRSASRSRSATRDARPSFGPTCSAPAPVPGHRRRASRLPEGLARAHEAGALVSSPPTCWPHAARAAGRVGRRHRGRQAPALRRADGLRRPARRLHRHATSLQAPDARPHHRRLQGRHGAPRCAWRCRPASSTSAARRRPATSAPRRCCSRSSPAMYAVYHGPDGLRAIAERVHGARPCSPRPCARSASTSRTTPSSTPSPCGATPPSGGASIARARAAHQPAASTTAGRRRARRDGHPAPTSRPARAFALVRRRPRPPARDRRPRRCPSCPAPPSRAPASSSRTRCSTATTPRPRCCATCTASSQGPVAHPLDDPARLLHHEAQRHRRDDAGHLARASRLHPFAPPTRPGLRRAVRASSRLARRDHRLRRGLAAAQRRLAGRVRRPARHPRLPRGRGEATATSA
jgi:hypothetical protein